MRLVAFHPWEPGEDADKKHGKEVKEKSDEHGLSF
jgi:hypothetical protein